MPFATSGLAQVVKRRVRDADSAEVTVEPPSPLLAGPETLARCEYVVIGDGPHPGPDAVAVARELAARLDDNTAGRVVLLAHTPVPDELSGPHPVPHHWVGPLLRTWAARGLRWPDLQAELDGVRNQVSTGFGAASLAGTGVGFTPAGVRLLPQRQIEISGMSREPFTIRPERIVLAPGAGDEMPDLPGAAETVLHTGTSVLDLPGPPDSAIVLGGGAYACELAQGLARNGVTVTLVEPGPQLLPDLPEPVAQCVIDALHEDGVRMMVGVQLAKVAPTLDGGAWLGTQEGDVAAEALVLAGRRRPRLSGLHLGDAGVQIARSGHIVVDDRLRTAVDGVLACGDATGLLEHGASGGPMARVVAANALSRKASSPYEPPLPTRVVRTDPEIVLIGAVDPMPSGAVHGVGPGPDEKSSVALVVSAPGGRGLLGFGNHPGRTLLGAVLVGEGAGEAAAQLVLAIAGNVPAATLIDLDAVEGTWTAAIQHCLARLLAG